MQNVMNFHSNNLKSYAMIFGKQCNLEQLLCLNVANKAYRIGSFLLVSWCKNSKYLLTDFEEKKKEIYCCCK